MSTERPGDMRPVDEAVDQAWRDASTEGPSPHSDAAILAAARADVARKPASRTATTVRVRRDWWARWQPLAAAAMVAGLAFVLVQMIPRDREIAPPVTIEMSRPESPAAAPSAQPSAPAAEVATPMEAARSPEVPQPLEAPPAAKSNEAAVAAEADATAGMRDRATVPAPSPAAAPETALAPGDWAARIESLYDADDLASAAAELRAFRAEYADADRHLPDTLREWAASVK